MNTSDKPFPWHGDEHHGQGGSYVFDEKSGKRKLADRTKEPKPEAPVQDAAKKKGAQ